MVDTLSKTERSELMGRVRNKDTGPEMLVRRLVHRMGYRYRLHRKDLPGKPDLVFPGRRKVMFVHGCFWHGHVCRRGDRTPKSNQDYWRSKIASNKKRDADHQKKLAELDWNTLIIWECEISDLTDLKNRILDFLG